MYNERIDGRGKQEGAVHWPELPHRRVGRARAESSIGPRGGPRGLRPARLLFELGLLCCLVGTGVAQGQGHPPGDRDGSGADARMERARARFVEGLEHVDGERWAQAEACFRQVLEVRWSAVAAYNLASARARQGGLIEATELLQRVVRDDQAEPAARYSAEQLLGELEVRVARLTLRPQGDAAGAEVWLDGERLPAAGLGVPVPVDPGPHEVVSKRDGKALTRAQLVMLEGEERQLTVELGRAVVTLTPQQVALGAQARPQAGRKPVLRVDQGAPPGAGERDDDLVSQWWFWAGVGGLLAGAGVATALALASGGPADPSVRGDFEPAVLQGEVR